MPSRAYSIDIPAKELRAHVRDGLSDEDIGKIHHCSKSTVERIRRRHGIVRAPVTVYNLEQYHRMKDLGLTEKEIRYIWNTQGEAFNNWKYRMGLTKPRNSNS
jgi:hypothetical protein